MTVDASSMSAYSDISSFKFITDDPDKYTFTAGEDGTCIITGTISGEQVNAVFPENSEIGSMFTDLGIELGSMTYNIEMKFAPLTDKGDDYALTACTMTLAEPFSIEEQGVEISFTKMDLAITVNGYNTVESIKIPDEALSAEEIDLGN